jgi:hypothetical protein
VNVVLGAVGEEGDVILLALILKLKWIANWVRSKRFGYVILLKMPRFSAQALPWTPNFTRSPNPVPKGLVACCCFRFTTLVLL